MKIVIDMPPKEFEHFKQFKGKFICDNGYDLIQAIKNGTPLPKGHGRLIDERQVVTALVHCDYLKDNVKCGDITKILDIATIIEADKAESEE